MQPSPFSCLIIAALTCTFNTNALKIYSNSSTSHNTISPSTALGDYILRGLATPISSHTGPSIVNNVPGPFGSSSTIDYFSAYKELASQPLGTYYNTKSYWVGTPTSNFPLHHDAITASPSANLAEALSSAMKCWSEIGQWRNSSAAFVNAHIPSRTWSVTSYYSSTVTDWSKTTTLYPSSVSTYKLCDGTPRANVRPSTTVLRGNVTLYGTWTKTLTPTIAPQPCSLGPVDCRLLRMDTDAASKDEDELLRQCGNPAHVEGGLQCLIGGGPVELIYFPVQKQNGSLCSKRSSAGIVPRPLQTELSHITTLGHTFSTDSVYLSFKTLYATYDGFWDHVGPTFSDLVVPLHSSDISTQCGGWAAAYGTGTPLDYADLAWPVPATAYKCQHRCSDSLTSSASLATPNNIIIFNIETVPPGPECNTIWSDVNPVLAVPTKIRQMVPEWSTCSFWNANLANFWFDPPIALQPAEAAASPTLPSQPETTPAAPSSTPTSPAAPSMTREVSVSQTAESSPSSAADSGTPSPLSLTESLAKDPGQAEETADPGHSIQDASSASDDTPSTGSPEVDTAPTPTVESNIDAQSNTQVAPAISVLTEALTKSVDATFRYDPTTTAVNDDPAFRFDPTNTKGDSTPSAALLSIGGDLETAIRTSDHYILGSTTLRDGQAATISNQIISANPSGLVVDSKTAPLSALPTEDSGAIESVVGVDGFTLTASAVSGDSQAAVIGTQTVSAGGPAAIISGQTVTHGSEGMAVISGSNAVPLTAVHPPSTTANEEDEDDNITYVLESLTVTAAPATGTDASEAISLQGTTLSPGGEAIAIDGTTVTMGPHGPQVIESGGSTAAMSRAPQTLPVIVGLSSNNGEPSSTSDEQPSSLLPTIATGTDDPTTLTPPSSIKAGASISTTTSQSGGTRGRRKSDSLWPIATLGTALLFIAL